MDTRTDLLREVIDGALGAVGPRRLLSGAEVTNLLLDLRNSIGLISELPELTGPTPTDHRHRKRVRRRRRTQEVT